MQSDWACGFQLGHMHATVNAVQGPNSARSHHKSCKVALRMMIEIIIFTTEKRCWLDTYFSFLLGRSQSGNMVAVVQTKFNLIVQEPIIRESLFAEVASIIQQLSEATGCSCADVSLSRHSTTNQRGKPVLLLCLDFASSGDLFNEPLARSFCRAVMHPCAHEILAQLSESALLGLSPVDGSDLAECWNMTVLDTVYVYGAETMERPQKRALSIFNPSLRPA